MGDDSEKSNKEEHPGDLETLSNPESGDLAPWAAAIAQQIVEAVGHIKERVLTGTDPGTSGTSGELH